MADEPNIELINDKWQNILPQYESNRFDLAIVDPPYGIGYENGGQYFDRNSGKKWDTNAPDGDYFEELKRVSKNQIIWGANYMLNNLQPTRGIIAWTKTVEIQGRSFSEWEMAWTSFNRRAMWINLKPFIRDGKRIHPTQKPVALYKWLLEKYANPGDTILDTHLGSGSSAIAAWQKKHDFVGIECDKEYYDDMLHRFKMNTNREYAMEQWQKDSEENGQQTIFS